MWVYKQGSGELFNAKGTCIAVGYSGSPDARNNPGKQDIAMHGPIPRGIYSINAPFSSPTHGPLCLRLTADIGNQMFGRSGFLMHGDSKEHPGAASEGCIIMPRAVRESVWKSEDYQLEVV